ncbi:uncharacterized protein [Spinacia oleracea]|uniref:Uncharacterized protein isoform X2 n=1 Tax=Spinacia oleracea TaxID=3562 RepID=A0ABM3QJA0_SPIOL|nr:uncharacterized protein LOC110777799 isoform X2 [Spinacia oleracea]
MLHSIFRVDTINRFRMNKSLYKHVWSLSQKKVLEDKPDQSKWTLKYIAFGRDIEFSWLARNLQWCCSILPKRYFIMSCRKCGLMVRLLLLQIGSAVLTFEHTLLVILV